GAWIRRVHADGDEAKADRKFAQMKQSFAVYGRAESEAFARRSRTWTIWLGFLGAFLLNIDSFSLLNGYLSDPAARVRVLGLQARILEGDLSRMPEAGTGEAERKVQEAQQRVVDAARAIQGSGLVPPEVRDELEEVVEAAETAQEAFDEAAATARSTLLLATTMTETFNIGWTLYPNCYEGSTDLRCMDLRRRLAAKAPAKPATQPATPPATQPGTPPASKPMVLAAVQPAPPAPGLLSHFPFLETLGFVVANDGAGFLRWFAGVFVTGILLGLGTPFWVQVFNNLLKMRNLLPNAGGGARQPRPSVPAGPVADQAPAGQPQVR
ncbi:MAG TPA: hypothetical protein VEB20_07030, partial [Azospirillaceae bacterium]|nr:hypothetical protein [Azospirillaceae bacterium]